MPLLPEENWPLSRVRRHDYICRECDLDVRAVRSARTSEKVRLHKENIGQRKRINAERRALYSAADAAHKVRPDGFVYVATNPAYPDVVKVGHSRSPGRRVAQANTFCPQRQWRITFACYFDDRIEVEGALHSLLRRCRVGDGEFFAARPVDVVNLIKHLKKEAAC